MTTIKFEDSIGKGVHQKLSLLTGKWKGTTRVWFSPDDLKDESLTEGTMRPVLDGRFIIHEYKGSFQGKPLEGVAIYGYDLFQQKFQSAWVDSFHMSTGIMFSESAKTPERMSVLGSYLSFEEVPQTWGWQTDIELINKDELVITMYNISPAGEEVKAVETRYSRVV